MNDAENDRLYSQLVKLGDMMGDGLHYESDGKWIEKEYRKILLQLGIIQKKPKDTNGINEFMMKRTQIETCNECNGKLKQTRSGSFRAKCEVCGSLYQLGSRKRAK